MTPQVTTTSCYVRIDDAQQRKEVCEKLQKQGYLPIDMAESIDSNYLFAFDGYVSRLYGRGLRGEQGRKELGLAGFIECNSIPLFLDLAGMRSDTDKNQLFVNESLEKMFRCKDKKFTSFYVDWEEGLTNIRDDFRRATAQEIINHHKQKGETK